MWAIFAQAVGAISNSHVLPHFLMPTLQNYGTQIQSSTVLLQFAEDFNKMDEEQFKKTSQPCLKTITLSAIHF